MTAKPEIQPWQKCPVCNGCGTVAQNFYNPDMTSAADTARKQCRTCNGRGIIAAHCPPASLPGDAPKQDLRTPEASVPVSQLKAVLDSFDYTWPEEGISRFKTLIHAAEKEQK
jgi:hypothetical protein